MYCSSPSQTFKAKEYLLVIDQNEWYKLKPTLLKINVDSVEGKDKNNGKESDQIFCY